MMISNEQQLLLLWRCLGCGVWLELCGICLDQARRRLHTRALRFIFDCVFTILSGVCLFIASLAINGGELRGAMLLAVAVGGYVSHLSLGRLLRLLISSSYRVAGAVDHASRRGLKKTAVFLGKIQKKVEFFYKKHLRIKCLRVYNRNVK